MTAKLSQAPCILLFLFGNSLIFCQNQNFEPSEWDHPAPKYNSVVIPKSIDHTGIVIIREKTDFDLTHYPNNELQKTVLLKIINEDALRSFSTISLPESFDVAENSELKQQGKLSRIKIPFIPSFRINYFTARIICENGKVINASPKHSTSVVRWIKSSGEYLDDLINSYTFRDLEVGDLIEYSYKVEYKATYGSDILYLPSKWPKLIAEYNFKYFVLPADKNNNFILTSNIPDSCVTVNQEINNAGFVTIKEKIIAEKIVRINYFIHASPIEKLPFIYFNMDYSNLLINSKNYSIVNLPDFKWTNTRDVNRYNSKFNIKRNIDIRKFIGKTSIIERDSNNLKFLNAINDSLNSFKYYSSNYLFYNNPRLYDLPPTEHLLKRRITESDILDIYEKILIERGVFYHVAKIQDCRLGHLNPLVRINSTYENTILAIPLTDSYIYFIPRRHGLKYFINELPFYYQGTLVGLFPSSYQPQENEPSIKEYKFIETKQGTENDNVRTENCLAKINVDSSNCTLEIEENLSGQFSTIIRPYYLGEALDSTVNPKYFKKCVEKPSSSHQKMHLRLKSEEFPFKFVVNCSEKLTLKRKNEIDLTNWFSFVIDKLVIPEEPTHDYYFDFPFSDTYNFCFTFDKSVEITNAHELIESLENEYFEVFTYLKKQETNYLLSVTAKVKVKILPKTASKKLIEFIELLEKINKFKIVYSP